MTSRIQNDPLEHHFWSAQTNVRFPLSNSNSQILESEQGLQLSNILKLFDIKTRSDTIQKPTLMEYLNTFSSGNTDNDENSNFELEKLITNFEPTSNSYFSS